MTRIAALTSGYNVPSTRFRVRQHIEPLRELGFAVREYVPRINKYSLPRPWPRNLSLKYAPQFYVWQALKLGTRIPGLWGSWRGEITWLERQILPGYLTLEPLLKGPVVFDVDDAIWIMRPFARSAVAATARRAAVVVAGNHYLAEWFSEHARDVRVVPTAIDTERFRPPEVGNRRDNGRFVIGWTGSRVNLQYLARIEAPLRRFLTQHRDAELLVIADWPPQLSTLPAEQVRFVPWSPSIEATALQDADVGIMPLTDDEETRGKCSFKMLQYMAVGLPVVVSPVGMNVEVLAMGELGLAAETHSDWFEALLHCYRNREHAGKKGETGRQVVEQHFSRQVVARHLAAIFGELKG